ncbi:MAG: ATP-binding protein [Actinobacteria bacterium]|nr:ATP-binding protein [Actinomycetota bacterium]
MLSDLTVAIASGKGGTGKTTVSSNLACAASQAGGEVYYVDCDVEEPNGHLFLKPRITGSRRIYVPVPAVDEEKCTYCGLCSEICQYSAIVCLNKTILTFENMCHGCGGCSLVCPVGAISEKGRDIGVLEEGRSGPINFIHGRLTVGEAMSPPMIKAVLSTGKKGAFRIIDAPPGTSCPAITSIKSADYVILVTEPTPFGINDLGLAIDMVSELGVPFSVVVNRSETNNHLARNYCSARGVRILAEIPDDRRVAEVYSRGELVFDAIPDFRGYFTDILISLGKEAKR